MTTGSARQKQAPVQETAPTPETPLRINLEGSPMMVAQLIMAMAHALTPPAPEEPTQLFLSVPEIARRTGISEDRLRAWVKAGKLTNCNSHGRILLSLADVRQAAQE